METKHEKIVVLPESRTNTVLKIEVIKSALIEIIIMIIRKLRNI